MVTQATSKETLQNVRYGSVKLNQESNDIRIDAKSSSSAINEASKHTLRKINEAAEEETKKQD